MRGPASRDGKSGLERLRRRVGITAAGTATALLLAAAPGGAKAPGPSTRQSPVATRVTVSLVAEAVTHEVPIFDRPGSTTPSRTLSNPTKTAGSLIFLVDRLQPGWLQVLLPVRPNDSTGWIRDSDVSLSTDPYRIVVALKSHQLTLYALNRAVLRDPIGVGTRETPTPGGRYYLTQLFRPPDPNGAYGPYAYSLSGFSNVLQTFEGGDAIIGLHGTDQPQFVGQDVSHGCIRLTNDKITQLAGLLPLGTPVQIVNR